MGAKQLKNHGLMNKTEFVSSDHEMLINNNLNSDLVYTVVYYRRLLPRLKLDKRQCHSQKVPDQDLNISQKLPSLQRLGTLDEDLWR